VSHFLHPDLPWTTCLSIGSTISSITAISKGRSIGTVSKPDSSESKKKRRKRETDEDDGAREVKVMGFPIGIKDDVVIFKGKPKPGSEASLVRRFGGEENLKRARTAMGKALENSWRGRESDLDKKAFSMYESFRPDVANGRQGWGRKGELVLSTIWDAVCEE
jgi:hypothetical protein